jgi:hypothetical protein
LRFAFVFVIALLILSGAVLLVPVVQKAVKTRTELRTAGKTAKAVWTNGSDEQRNAMLDFIDLTEGSYRDSLVTKVWDELPELVRISITESFRR